MSLKENLEDVRINIKNTCDRIGRDYNEVTLIAVSKTKPLTMLEEIYECQMLDFGENKVQELKEKEAILPKDICWHMIGHLQKNKVKYIAEFVSYIHSVESLSLAEVINKEGIKANKIINILIEVNIAQEESKFGLNPKDTEAFIKTISKFSNIKVCGLMTVAPYVSDPEENRIHFKNLKHLLVDINNKNLDNINMHVLSMGMSNDYRIAIEEGATMVRVGTDIFGERNYKL